MHDRGEGIGLFIVDQHIQPHQFILAIPNQVVFHGGIALGAALHLIEEIRHHLRQRHLIVQRHPVGGDVFHVDEFTPPLLAQLHQGAVIGIGGIDLELHIGFFDRFALLRIGQGGGVIHHLRAAIQHVHPIHHRWGGHDQIQVVFPLQPLLHDLHVQQAQKAAAEAEAHRAAGFRLVLQGRIGEPQLVERFPQIGILIRIGGEQAAEHHRLGFRVARQGLGRRGAQQGDRVAHPGIGHRLDRGRHVAHLPRMEALHLPLIRRHHPHLIELIALAAGHQQHLVLLADRAAHHPEIHDHAPVGVVIGIKNQGLQGLLHPIRRRRHPIHHRLQDLRHPQARFGRAGDGLRAIQPDDRLHLRPDPLRIGPWQVDLVEHRNDLQIVFQRQIHIRQGLGLHPLARIHHQQRPLTGLQGAAHLIGKINVARRINQIENVGFAISRLVFHPGGLELDRDAPLPFQLHVVQELLLHVARRHGSRVLQQTIGQGGFAVVDMGNDAEIADPGNGNVGHAPEQSHWILGR